MTRSMLDEQHQAAHALREGLRGGYDPSPGPLDIMPDSAACNHRRDLLRQVLREVGLARTIAITRYLAETEEEIKP